ncbi:MAG: tetratricopeptide repeat protein [Treponema sp.]|nr:tetratricopeptide repeat protein [Treponema sp.]
MNTKTRFSGLFTASVLIFSITAASFIFASCENNKKSVNAKNSLSQIDQLESILKQETLSDEARYGVMNKITTVYLANQMYSDVILKLTDWVENNPKDKYNAYWLLMVAHAYMQSQANPMAEYYFERIIKNYPDLTVQGQSVHFLCLENLIKISQNSDSRIKYFNQLIGRFPSQVSITEMYIRLAREYEKLGEWNRAMKTYTMFLEQPDASRIQIPDIPDAYNYAKNLIDFNNSPKNWMFRSLKGLENAVRSAIYYYQPNVLDSYRTKVNFFAVSWKQDENASKVDFSMNNYMHGNRISCDKELIPGPTPNEAYLRTTGWSNMPVWYFYFREINFPADPSIHGTWEWAGIYIGDML